jgi:hypothetical protein
VRVTRRLVLLAVAVAGLAACGDDDSASEATGGAGTSATAATTPAETSGTVSGTVSDSVSGSTAAPPTGLRERCLVRLHGKGGTGGEPSEADGVTILAPTGNADGWGAKQWLYFPDDEYEAARGIVADAVEQCEQVIVNGFSNGAAFAAKLYCRGETFDGRVVGVVVDDPVVDASVEGCAPDPAVTVTLYWTGALDATAQPGWECAEGDWTCEGGTTIGIEAFADAIGVEPLDSPFDAHEWYVDAPETMAWVQ